MTSQNSDFKDVTQSTTCDVCHRTFGTVRGMRIHQGKVCRKKTKTQSRPEPSGSGRQTRGGASPETHHSGADAPHVSESSPAQPSSISNPLDEGRRPKVLWPAAKEKQLYQEYEDQVMDTYSQAWKDEDERRGHTEDEDLMNEKERLKLFSDTLYNVAAEKFGCKTEGGGKEKGGKSRRERVADRLRREKKEMRKRWRQAQPEQREGLKALYEELKKRSREVMRKLRRNARRREARRTREQFLKDPFGSVKKLFAEARNGELACSKQELDDHVRATYSDPRREEEIPYMQGLKRPPPPGVKFNMGDITVEEVSNFVRKARAKSAPGRDGISYKAFKYCPKLRKSLAYRLGALWEKPDLLEEWCTAEGVYLPKEENASEIGQFRPISLLSVLGKIYMGVIARRAINFLQTNGFVDESVQKAGIPGIPGCIEHAYTIWDAIQQAKKEKLDLNVVWLDLANAYGSVPHKLLKEAMQFFYVPDPVIKLMMQYYDCFRMRFSTKTFCTEWHRLEVGIAQGCTISVIWFVLVMEMLLRSAECNEEEAGVQAPKKAFMDDVTLLTREEDTMRRVLRRLDELVAWSRMRFKARKSRSLALRKGKQQQIKFSIAGEEMPTVKDQPVKSLGRWYKGDLSDKSRGVEVYDQAVECLKRIQNSKLPNKFKLWALQYGLYPRLAWPLMIYEVALSRVEMIEQAINVYIRRWLGLPKMTTTSALYRREGALQLPLTSIVEIFKAGKVRTVMMLRESKDTSVKDNPPDVRTATKWQAEKETDAALAVLEHGDIMGAVQASDDKSGLGLRPFAPFCSKTPRERRLAVTQQVAREEQQKRSTSLAQCGHQGQVMAWEENVIERKLTWQELWKWTVSRTSFLIRSTYDVLPSPVNLARWGKEEEEKCHLCDKKGTVKHILSSCQPALGRYTWRHNLILQVLYDAAQEQTEKSLYAPGPREARGQIDFVPAGKRPPAQGEKVKRRESGEGDWVVSADLKGSKEKFPVPTSQRPDLIIWEKDLMRVHIIELTVPHEDNIEAAHERKQRRYEGLVEELEAAGWQVEYFPVEVGCRGFVGTSIRRWLSRAGFGPRKASNLVKSLQETAEKASHWIWNKRDDNIWQESL